MTERGVTITSATDGRRVGALSVGVLIQPSAWRQPNQRLQLAAPFEARKRWFVPWRCSVYSEAPSAAAALRRS
jgi:hypothetical protein